MTLLQVGHGVEFLLHENTLCLLLADLRHHIIVVRTVRALLLVLLRGRDEGAEVVVELAHLALEGTQVDHQVAHLVVQRL